MNSMCDLNPGRMQRSRLQIIFRGLWFPGSPGLPAGPRTGLPSLLWATLVNLILFGLFLACATPVYETNDDLVMQLIASGSYTNHPDAHLVFTNILIGQVLRFLYGTWAGCNWYLIYILVVHYVALTAIAFVVMARRPGWLSVWLYVGFFLIAETHILLNLQFTTTAFLAGTAGLLLLVDGLQPGQPAHRWKVIAGVAFVSLMGLIREPVALFLVAVACAFLVERFGLAGWRRLLGAGLACVAVLFILHGVNYWAYQRNPAWAEYSEYNRLRGEIHDTPLEKFIPEAVSAVGWSQNDGWMFSKQYLSDPKVYAGVPRMRLVLARLKTSAQADSTPARKPSARFHFLSFIFSGDAGALTVLALLNGMCCALFAGAFKRRLLVTLLISYGIYVLLCFYLLTTAHLPERVAYNIPLFINVICLYWAAGFYGPAGAASWPGGFHASAASSWRPKISRWLALVLLAVGVGLYLSCVTELAYGLWLANADNRNLHRISHKILEPVRTLMPDQKIPILVALPLDSVLEKCIFFYPPTKKIPFVFVPYGWITYSPVYNQILEQHHLHPYPRSLVDRPDIFFLVKRKGEWLEPLSTFYREHYGLDVRFDMVLNTDEMPQFEDCQLYLYQAHSVRGNTPVGTAP